MTKIKLPESEVDFLETDWLKSQLMDFCRDKGLSAGGSKAELTARICGFLKGEPQVREVAHPQKKGDYPIFSHSLIDPHYQNDERHRAFFLKEIGERFKFNVLFMNWMKENRGVKTYQDAVQEWLKIEREKKSGIKYEISSQFEYNQYTRDFFQANPKLTRKDSILCWNHKKSIPGNHRYEDIDLKIL